MRRRLTALFLFTAGIASAQMHRVHDAGAVTRAVSVFEWTGNDIAKPVSSRIVPVSLFIHGHFEDAGIYMAQPIPLAIMPDTRYQLQTAGVITGNVDLSFARNLKVPGSAVSSNYDDGWFGYGKFQPLPKPKFESAAVAKTSDKSDGRPRFGKRSPTSKDGDKATEKEQASVRDPDSPDPERPTFQKEDITTGDPRKDRRKEDKKNDVSGVESVPGGPGSTPANDDDRPVFRKRTASEAPATDTVGVTEKRDGMLNDPTRPTLHRGRPSGSATGEDLRALRGLPEDIHQAVAVSDAVDRPEHNFAHKWSDDAERGKVKAQLEEMARAVIANPKLAQETANDSANPALGGYAVTTPLAARQAAPSEVKTSRPAGTRRKGAAAKKSPAAKPAQAPTPLQDEKFAAYDLAYNSVPTYVLTAQTSGVGDQLKYVAVVASPDTFGTMQPIMRSITDAAHLNLVPRLRLVDVVDPDASNRASLLFELRRENSRFFALYRIYGAKASQIFLSGVTQ